MRPAALHMLQISQLLKEKQGGGKGIKTGILNLIENNRNSFKICKLGHLVVKF